MSVKILNSHFDNNGEDGVQIVVDDGEILEFTLNGNLSTNNLDQGYEIDPNIAVRAHGNHASGNDDDTLPS